MLIADMPPVRLEVPHEPGQWIEVRQLGWADLEACRDAATRKFFASLRDIGTEVVREFAAMQQAGSPELAAAREAREASAAEAEPFDRELLFKKSIVAWSYQPAYRPELIAQLDERTADWLYHAIVAIYAGGESDDRKNACTPSTAG